MAVPGHVVRVRSQVCTIMGARGYNDGTGWSPLVLSPAHRQSAIDVEALVMCIGGGVVRPKLVDTPLFAAPEQDFDNRKQDNMNVEKGEP